MNPDEQLLEATSAHAREVECLVADAFGDKEIKELQIEFNTSLHAKMKLKSDELICKGEGRVRNKQYNMKSENCP